MPSTIEIHDSLVIHSAHRADVHPGMSWHVNKVSWSSASISGIASMFETSRNYLPENYWITTYTSQAWKPKSSKNQPGRGWLFVPSRVYYINISHILRPYAWYILTYMYHNVFEIILNRNLSLTLEICCSWYFEAGLNGFWIPTPALVAWWMCNPPWWMMQLAVVKRRMWKIWWLWIWQPYPRFMWMMIMKYTTTNETHYHASMHLPYLSFLLNQLISSRLNPTWKTNI